MKKVILFILTILFTVSVTGCSKCNKIDEKIRLSQSTVILSVFEKAEIIATYQNISELLWENTNDEVLEIEECGNYVKLFALKEGESTIRAKGKNSAAECVVTVNGSDSALGLNIERVENSIELAVQSMYYIPTSVSYNGEKINESQIIYSVDDESIAIVSENGIIKAIKAGKTTVRVKAEYNGKFSNERQLEVIVKSGPVLNISHSYVELYPYDEQANIEYFPNSKTITVTIIDGDIIKNDIEYRIESNDLQVVTVENNKTIKAVGIGDATLTVKSTYKERNFMGYVYVSVEKIPDVKISLNKSETTLYLDAPSTIYPTTEKLVSTVTVNGNLERSVSYRVDDGIAVSVTDKGVISAVAEGKAIVSANYRSGGKNYKAFCEVTVLKPLTYMQSHKDYNRSGVYAAIASGTTLNCGEIDLVNDKTIPLINFNIIPNKRLANKYLGSESSPIPPDSLENKSLEMFYINIADGNNEKNNITVAIRIAKEREKFGYNIRTALVGVKASTYTSSDYYYGDTNGYFTNNSDLVREANMRLSIGSGYGVFAKFSFYGYYLDTIDNQYTMGISLEGTTIYIVNNKTPIKVWDLKNDAIKYEEKGFKYLRADEQWNGFSSNKVKISIVGSHYEKDAKTFNLMLLGLGGSDNIKPSSIANMSITSN